MTNRFSYVTSISCEDIFTDEVKELLIHLHDKFLSELDEIRKIYGDKSSDQESWSEQLVQEETPYYHKLRSQTG